MRRDIISREPIDYVVCRECGKTYKTIEWSHLKHKHDMTIEEYEEKYPDAPRICIKTLRKLNGKEDELWQRIKEL